jgi:hypothetical protein
MKSLQGFTDWLSKKNEALKEKVITATQFQKELISFDIDCITTTVDLLNEYIQAQK